ncbi:MAG: sigma-54 dependent transcriptional regulator [Methylococcales bacterium]|nr:sigma-54 dependent transcriptional regulator [Methylococcales bacterium]
MKNQSILVVDDEPKMRRLLEIMLTQLNHQVHQAEDGQQAADFLKNNSVDLVITDLKMPNMDGIALLRHLRENNNNVSVIVVTAYGTVETAVETMKYGACDYIVRPFELDAVEAAVDRALNLNKVQRENRYLREEINQGWGDFIGSSEAMKKIYTLIQQVALTKTSVLIQGETGTGKELVARAIHQASPRAKSLFVAINCAAIPVDLLESELFGYSKGAFTGANKDHVGKFELADGGTLFLDEITEMDFSLQAKLLRVLQERSLERLGSHLTIPINVRVIAASNQDSKQAIVEKKLREDLFYRLNVFTIDLPPLRNRQADILPLAYHFLKKYTADFGYSFSGMTAEAEASLINYQWLGNVRELENVMERAAVLSAGVTISFEHLPIEIISNQDQALPSTVSIDDNESLTEGLNDQVEKLEKQLIQNALEKTNNNKAAAAQILKISERSLWYKIKKYC